MNRKPIKIDWDELEAAFDTNNEELDYYLDLVTGQVILEGEGEGDEFEDEEDFVDDASLEAGTRRDDTRLPIEPPGATEELSWMNEFARETEGLDPELAGRLDEAGSDEAAVSAFREALKDHDEARDRWFAYRGERLHEAIEAWLDANGVRAVSPPPWRG